jgi:putative membrane protein
MMHGYWGGPMGVGWAGGIFILIFWVFLIIGVVWVIRYLIGPRTFYSERHDMPLEILKKRYAKGEIDKKEFEEKKKDLGE